MVVLNKSGHLAIPAVRVIAADSKKRLNLFGAITRSPHLTKSTVFSLLFFFCSLNAFSEDGYDLWLRYVKVTNPALLASYRSRTRRIFFPVGSAQLKNARDELYYGLDHLLGGATPGQNGVLENGSLLIGTPGSLPIINETISRDELKKVEKEGYLIKSALLHGKRCTIVTANSDVGILYGVFNLLKIIQTYESLSDLNITEKPSINRRILDHWDNLDGSIERGYAGQSLWNWQQLPDYTDKRYVDYARANASLGINGVVLNNVNSNAGSLATNYIVKTAALADIFRGYGIKVYLTGRFTAPIELGKLSTADPLDPQVIKWWKEKVKEIYHYIPDFGGFLIKANSEGQPGPEDYHRSHADGANMFGRVLKPYGGIVMWRAFVYDISKNNDRTGQAYLEFKPLDGQFDDNVVLQCKNGSVDFQPREVPHPLFAAMQKTVLGLEFEITQEYFGFSNHLVYLAPLYKECFDFDTYSKGKGSTVARVVDGSLFHHKLSLVAGVANTGSDTNWCGHPFAQANWFAFGRLAWNPRQSSALIADEWIKMTFTNDNKFVQPVKEMMLWSREAAVNYMTPLGLTHIMRLDQRTAPGPWDKDPNWDQWNSHRSDSLGIGIDRTRSGSDLVDQYPKPLSDLFNDLNTTPEKYLLWFHHVKWSFIMRSGDTFWGELVRHYYSGVDSVRKMQRIWNKVGPMIDSARYNMVKSKLITQEKEAVFWRDACVLYFQTYAKMPIPDKYEKPKFTLAHYMSIRHPDW